MTTYPERRALHKNARDRRYYADTIMDSHYADDIALLKNILAILPRVRNRRYLPPCECGQKLFLSILNYNSLWLVDKFRTSAAASHLLKIKSIYTVKTWTTSDGPSITWKFNLSDKSKQNFLQTAVLSIQLYWCSTWTLKKRKEKSLDGICTRMLRALLKKPWKQQPRKQQ